MENGENLGKTVPKCKSMVNAMQTFQNLTMSIFVYMLHLIMSKYAFQYYVLYPILFAKLEFCLWDKFYDYKNLQRSLYRVKVSNNILQQGAFTKYNIIIVENALLI